MLPRSSANVRSGRRLASWARRRTEPVATRAPVGQRGERGSDQRVARVGTLGHGAEREAGGGLRRQVLGRVDREVGVAAQDGVLDLLDEDAGAAERVDRDVGPTVAGGLDDDDLDGHPEARHDEIRLEPGQCAPARRDAQRRPAGHQSAVGGSSGRSSAKSSDSASA